MKNIVFLLLLLFSFTGYGAPSYGQEFNDSQKSYLNSENLLVNPGFESGVTGWTTTGTASSESVNVIKGRKSFKIVLANQVLTTTQDSTRYAAQFADGVQGLLTVRIKTLVSGLRVCARQAGVVSTSLCVSVPSNGKWSLIKIPFILGATSNGLSINSNGVAVSGTVFLDDAYLGAQDVKQEVDQSRFYGSWSEAGAVNCSRSFSSSSYAILPVDTDCSSPVVSGSITATTTKLLAFNMSAEAGTYQIIPMLSIANPTTSNVVSCKIVANGISSSEWTRFARDGGFEGYDQPTTFTLTLPSAFNGQFELQCKSSASTTAFSLNVGNMVNSFYVYRLGSTSTYSSNNADTDWASCGHTPSSFTGFGTGGTGVTNIETFCKRQGGDLLMRGKFTAGTGTAVEARVALPTWNGIVLSSKSTSIIPTITTSGTATRGNAAATGIKDFRVLIEPSTAYFVFGYPEWSQSINPLTKATGSGMMLSGDTLSLDARIPINGWENSNVIVAQLSGLESCKDSYECSDTFSARISASGIVESGSENIDWINGFCTLASNVFTCPFKTGVFTVPPNITITANAGTQGYMCSYDLASSSSVQVRCSFGSTPSNIGFTIKASKASADFLGKTAKAVSSDANVRSIGAVGVDIQSVYFGSGANCGSQCATGSCTICNSVGTKVTSVTWQSTGTYRINGIDGTKYNCTGTGVGGAWYPLYHDRPSSTTTYATVASGTTVLSNSALNSVTCLGNP